MHKDGQEECFSLKLSVAFCQGMKKDLPQVFCSM